MAITDSQKVDYLFKKVGYSVAKTDTSSVKSPSNESIASPLVIRGGSIWTNSDNIPSTIPASNSSVVLLYNDSVTSTVQTTNDGTASANRTWLTNLTDWIDPSFGSTYQVKVYLDTASNTAPQTTGTQLFADGTGSDEWFFDYASGVLNFIGTSLPSVTFTGKRIFVSGARYVGNKGLGNLGNTTISGTITADAIIQNGRPVVDTSTTITVTGDATGSGNISNIALTLANTGVIAGIYGSADDEYADRIPKITVDSKGRITNIANVTLTQVGNVTFTNTTISTTSGITLNSANNGNITLNANGTGIVKISGDDAFAIPTGNTAARPTNVSSGYLRYNTDLVTIEYYNGSAWENNLNISGYLSSETIYPTGATNNYTLIADATTDGVLVSINGTLQQPTTAYTVSGNVITFTETPLSSDVIEVRAIAMNLVSIPTINDGAIRLTTNSTTGNITAIGNLVISPGYEIVAGNITGTTNGYTIGYKDVPQISAANVTLSITDGGKHYYSTSATPITLTVPSHANVAFPTGTAIMIVNRGTGNITISKQVEANLYLAGNTTSASRTLTSYGIASLIKVETNVWMINGTGVS